MAESGIRAYATAMKWLKCKAAPRQYCQRYDDCVGCSYYIKSYNTMSDGAYAESLVGYIDELRKATPAPSKWISVDDELPPEGLEVLVCTPAGGVTIGKTVRANGRSHSEFVDKSDRRIAVAGWQPKPLKIMRGINDEGDIERIRAARRRLIDEYEAMHREEDVVD